MRRLNLYGKEPGRQQPQGLKKENRIFYMKTYFKIIMQEEYATFQIFYLKITQNNKEANLHFKN